MLIAISNTRSKRVNKKYNQTVHTPGTKYVYMQIFMFVGFAVIEIRLFNQKKKKKKKQKKI